METHEQEMATSLAIPLWIPQSAPIWRKLNALREARDAIRSADITAEWRIFTPARRHELLSYGWRIGDTRTPGQVTIHAGRDAITAKFRQAVQAKQAARLGSSP
ncbi:MAG: hypothetical protein Q7R45_08065 [Sulfuricaulis sp.]|nr:hypothetical protein [Sulfuricaulis sp.]